MLTYRTCTLLALAMLLRGTPVLAQATVVIFARHGEVVAGSPDPELSDIGRARAEALATAVASAKPTVVITTPVTRARSTATIIAKRFGVSVIEIQVANGLSAHVEQIVRTVRDAYVGSTVIIIGHSNTLPAVIAGLGGPPIENLCESEFGTLMTMVLDRQATGADGKLAPRLIASTYGTADSPQARSCHTTR